MGSANKGARTHTPTTRLTGASYDYQIRATNTSGSGAASNVATIKLTPAAPTLTPGAVAYDTTADTYSVALNWTLPTDSSVTSWEVRNAGGDADTTETQWETRLAAATWRQVSTSATDRSATITGISKNSAHYRFQARAKNVAGNGETSNAAEASLLPIAAPANFKATLSTGSTDSVVLTWTLPANPETITKYQYRKIEGDLAAIATGGKVNLRWQNPNDTNIKRWQYRQKEGTNDYIAWTNILGSGATTTSYIVENLDGAKTYTFQVRALTKTDYTPLKELAGSWNVINATDYAMTWDNPNNANISKYKFRQKEGANDFGAWTDIPNSDKDTVTYTATGLTANTAYTFEIAPVETVGGEERPLPIVKIWSIATADANDKRTLRWTEPADEHDIIQKYEVRKKTGSNDWPPTAPYGWGRH